MSELQPFEICRKYDYTRAQLIAGTILRNSGFTYHEIVRMLDLDCSDASLSYNLRHRTKDAKFDDHVFEPGSKLGMVTVVSGKPKSLTCNCDCGHTFNASYVQLMVHYAKYDDCNSCGCKHDIAFTTIGALNIDQINTIINDIIKTNNRSKSIDDATAIISKKYRVDLTACKILIKIIPVNLNDLTFPVNKHQLVIGYYELGLPLIDIARKLRTSMDTVIHILIMNGNI